MIGLDAAGKTTVLNSLKLGQNLNTIPTIGFNVETIEYKNLSMMIWDLGGQEKIRILWHHYFEHNHGIIFVVDSLDSERVEEAKEELHKALADESLIGLPLVVLANKQDLKGSLKPDDLAARLDLGSIARGRKWFIQGCVATEGVGTYEGLDWLSQNMKF